jgi:hypothetical protein
VILGLMNAIEALVVRTACWVRSFKGAARAGRDQPRWVHRPVARGVGSIG